MSLRKIALITMEYPPNFYGGAGIYAKNLAEHLSRYGILIDVYFPSNEDTIEKVNSHLRLIGVKHLQLPFFRLLTFSLKTRIMVSHLDYDIIHAVIPEILFLIKSCNNVKLTCTIHHSVSATNNAFKRFGLKNLMQESSILPFNSYIEKKSIEKVDGIVVVSQKSYDQIFNGKTVTRHLQPHLLVRVIHNGISNEFFTQKGVKPKGLDLPFTERKYLLYVGSKDPRKGVDVLLQAYSELLSLLRDPPLLVLVGKGDLQPLLQKFPKDKQKQLLKHIYHLNYVTTEELIFLYKHAFLNVLASWAEGFSTVLLEGISQDLPFVATDTAGAREVYDLTRSGICVPLGDYKHFAHSIYNLIVDEDKYNQLKQNAIASKRRFKWENSITRYLEFYNDIINQEK